jgi:hypothetical protein
MPLDPFSRGLESKRVSGTLMSARVGKSADHLIMTGDLG